MGRETLAEVGQCWQHARRLTGLQLAAVRWRPTGFVDS